MTRLSMTLATLWLCLSMCAPTVLPASGAFRGVYFNPQVQADPNFPWLLFYGEYRTKIRAALRDLHETAHIDLVDVFVLIPNSLRTPARGNLPGETVGQWANTAFLDHVARFVDDCHDFGITVELDLVDNRWVPASIDSSHHIGRPGNPWWPVADATPWVASAAWYRQVIEYIEAHTAHPDAIAMWCMMGNYQLGAAEPVLWNDPSHPEIIAATERFVKDVWPVFRSAGKRPKASPIMLPILSSDASWQARTPMDRLAAFTNLKRWLDDDLKSPPDYWVMSAYPFCDPAPDGFRYLEQIVKILGSANAHRIVSTDLKGIGHEEERRATILNRQTESGADMLRWHIAQCRKYGFAGWWMWAYQDTPSTHSGLRTVNGSWKQDMLTVFDEAAHAPSRE